MELAKHRFGKATPMTAMAHPTEYREASGFIAEIIRTNRRKSADIRVEEGAVSIVVPSETPLEKIDQLLASKRRWIKEKWRYTSWPHLPAVENLSPVKRSLT